MRPLIIVLALALGGCATVLEGTDQNVAIVTHPENALCFLYRNGEALGRTSRSGEQITISKSRNTLVVQCNAAGYLPARQEVESSVTTAAVASFVLSATATVVDWSTGAMNAYPETVTLLLKPEPARSAPATMSPVADP